jgi:hypothetical protein
VSAVDEFGDFISQWDTRIRGTPVPSIADWGYFRGWAKWNSISVDQSSIDFLRNAFTMLDIELRYRVKRADLRALGSVNEPRFQSGTDGTLPSSDSPLGDSTFTTFTTGSSLANSCTGCSYYSQLTPASPSAPAVSACLLHEDLVLDGTSFESTCDGFLPSGGSVSTGRYDGIRNTRFFQSYVVLGSGNNLELLFNSLDALWQHDLVEVQDITGAALPSAGGAAAIQNAFEQGGKIILDVQWDKYARAKLGDPANSGFTVRVPGAAPVVDYELVIVMGETVARAYGSARSRGNNQYRVRQEICSASTANSLPGTLFTYRIGLNEFLQIFRNNDAGHMVDSYLLRNLQDRAGANHLLDGDFVYIDPDVRAHNLTRTY